MISPLFRFCGLCGFILLLSSPASSQAPAKRALTHADYAAWRAIQSPTLSADGSVVAYSVTPQEGDGEFVLRQVASGKEFRHSIGSRLVVTPPAKAAPGPSPPRFSPDGKSVLFPISPSQADRTKSKEATRSDLGIMDVTTGQVVRLERVQRFMVPKDGGIAVVAYLRGVAPAPVDPTKGIRPKGPSAKAPTVPPSELVLRNLTDGKERTFAHVTEFSLTRDGRWLVWSASDKKEEDNGVFAVPTTTGANVVTVQRGPGKFSRLTWDEKQTQMVYFRTPPPPTAPGVVTPPPRIAHWRPSAAPASALSIPVPAALLAGLTLVAAQATTPGAIDLTPTRVDLGPGSVIREQGGLSFSSDGTRVYFGVAVPPPAPRPLAPGEEKANVELWHYQDDFIQSMQKSQYARTQARTFRAVFHLGDRSCRQLADVALADVVPASAGDWALGLDDRAYRRLVGSELSSPMADVYLVDCRSGSRKRVQSKAAFPPSFSAGGKYVLSFDGKDWHAMSVPEGKTVNLTEKLGVSFANELNDMPMTPGSYGLAGWTAADEHVLIYDRFDVWQVAPDGSGAKNLTATGRKDSTQFRVVQLDRESRTIDLGKPILVRAECEKSRDTGFYRLDVANKKFARLIMGARNYGVPVRAERGDKLLLTVSTFADFPDLFLADADFREVKRVSDANPQKANFVWGKSELVKYKNSDGVKLQGVLVKPENFDPTKKYPMIVYIYERLSQNLHRFVDPQPGTSINPTFYASNGYLVLMPDINYTVGYPGQSAIKCVMPAVQAVVDLGCVDEKAIGLQGHSWGGYQTAFMVTQTTRFKAASAGAPVVNMTSAYGGIRWGTGLPRQFQYEKTQSRIGGTLWQYPTRFLENSPLFHADRVKTPLLMLHNDQDEAVPYQQGLEYYLALRRLGKEAYLFNYPGEAHGLRRRVNQKDYTVRLQQFFDHHLKGAAKPDWMEKGLPYTPPRATQTRIP